MSKEMIQAVAVAAATLDCPLLASVLEATEAAKTPASLLDAVLAATAAQKPAVPVRQRFVVPLPPPVKRPADVTEAPAVTAEVVKVSPPAELRAEVEKWRALARQEGGTAAALAAEQTTASRAAAYLAAIKEAVSASRAAAEAKWVRPPVAEPTPVAPAPVAEATPVRRAGPVAAGARAVTPKQWGYIRHLRQQCRRHRRQDVQALAVRDIGNNRRGASTYIAQMLAALNEGAPVTSNGGMICCCRVVGCRIGPMMRR